MKAHPGLRSGMCPPINLDAGSTTGETCRTLVAPMADGGMRKCSAGACPPQRGYRIQGVRACAEGVVPGRANSLYQATRRGKPVAFHTCWQCRSASRHERLLPGHLKTLYIQHRYSRESGNPEGKGAMKACPGLRSGIDRSRSLSLVIRGIPSSLRPLNSSFRRSKACWGPESTPIRGRNPEGWGEGIVARGFVPRLGRAASSPALHHPAPSHFHPLMRPSQGHGDSRERRNPGEGRPAHPCHIESLWAVPPQPTVLVRSQFANAQDKLRSNLNSSRNIALNTVQ